MTEIVPQAWTCPVCGLQSTQNLLASTNTFGGSTDLDSRPGGMARETLWTAVWSCSSCGFAGIPSGGEGEAVSEAVRAAVRSGLCDVVRGDKRTPPAPELARDFLCRAELRLVDRRYAEAGWDALRAAWVCDDEGVPQAARRCRAKAAESWKVGGSRGQRYTDGGFATEQLLLADVLRRAGEFDEARSCCHRGLSGRPKDPIRSLLEYELELISQGDDTAHSTREVV